MIRQSDEQPDPETLLRTLLEFSPGRFKLYLGYAPGVGKTLRMLQEAQLLVCRGVDLVVGIVETHGRPETARLLEGLEVVDPRRALHQGVTLEELDLEAVLARRPATVIIDELAHTNAPGSSHTRRYEDVEALLAAGISVISTMNIQHLESVAETAGRLIGFAVHERVPARIVQAADEIQLVDTSPEKLLERLAQGKVDARFQAGGQFFRSSTLVYLRELALRTVAGLVDDAILVRQGSGVAGPAGVRERLLVAVSTNPSSARLIRRGARIAERFDGELFVVYVDAGNTPSAEQQRTLAEHRQLCERAGGNFVVLQGHNISQALVGFALEKHITQVILGESMRTPVEQLLRGSVINDLLRSTSNLDVLVVGETESVGPLPPPASPPVPSHTCFLPAALERQTRGCGRHKIYLGAAPGVGKTCAMLQEAHDLSAAGVDVVCGLIETHGRAETAALITGLEVIPRRQLTYRGRAFSEFDRGAVLARRPAIVLLDELAHTNLPGLGTARRYQDVEILLAAGIDVISTLNIQHLESLNTLVERTTGVRVRETVPDLVVECADEVVLIDLTTDELQRRLREGKIYAPAKIEQALSHFFRAENLIALRELALREVADDCTARKFDTATPTEERVLVCTNLRSNAQQLIRRGARIARRLGAALVVTYIQTTGSALSEAEKRQLDGVRRLSAELGGSFIELSASNVAERIVSLAHEQAATLLVLGESRRSHLEKLLHGSVIEQVLRRTRNLDTLIVGNFEHE